MLKDNKGFQKSSDMVKIVEVYPEMDGPVCVVGVLVNGKIHKRPMIRQGLLL